MLSIASGPCERAPRSARNLLHFLARTASRQCATFKAPSQSSILRGHERGGPLPTPQRRPAPLATTTRGKLECRSTDRRLAGRLSDRPASVPAMARPSAGASRAQGSRDFEATAGRGWGRPTGRPLSASTGRHQEDDAAAAAGAQAARGLQQGEAEMTARPSSLRPRLAQLDAPAQRQAARARAASH